MSTEPKPSVVQALPMQRKIGWIVWGAILVGVVGWGLLLLIRPGRSAAALLRFLPPGADFYLVADLEALQFNPAMKKFLAEESSLAPEEEYVQFVKRTGFRYQQDLKQVAMAKLGTDWWGAARVKLDQTKIVQHLESPGGEKIQEDGFSIYRYGKVRPFRLVLLPGDLALFTVGSDAEPIRQMVKRFRGQLGDSAAVEMEQANSAGHLTEPGELQAFGRMDWWLNSSTADPSWRVLELAKAFLKGSKLFYISVNSSMTALDFRLKIECGSPADAKRVAQSFQVFFKLIEAMPPDSSRMDPKIPALLAGISVQQVQSSVLLQRRWDRETLGRLEQNSREASRWSASDWIAGLRFWRQGF